MTTEQRLEDRPNIRALAQSSIELGQYDPEHPGVW